MVMIGTDWTVLDTWSDSYNGATIYWRVLGIATIYSDDKMAGVDFKWEVSFTGDYAFNNDAHSYSITCTDNGGHGHNATSSWAFGSVTPSWTVPTGASGGDNYWASVAYRANGTASFNATFSGTRWNGNSFSETVSISLPNITATQYTVTLSKNGGSGGTSSVKITQGTTAGNYPSITLPTREGYTFNGYWTATSGGTQYYNASGAGTRTFNNANQTWYAQWIINTYTVTINPNGGSFTSSKNSTASSTEQTYTVNYGSNITSINATRSGFSSIGWYTTAAAGGIKVIPNNGSLNNIKQDYTIYAQWFEDIPAPDPVCDISANISGTWYPSVVWVNVNGTWYRSIELSTNVSGTWRKAKTI